MGNLAVIIACGKDEQISAGQDTAFLSLGNRPVLAHSLQTYQASTQIDSIVLVVSKDRVEGSVQVARRFGCSKVCGVVVGGATRLSSLRAVFQKVEKLGTVILVQEASRPFVTHEMIDESIKAAKRYGCAIAAHRIPDSVKVAPKGLKVDETLERNTAWCAQTPQVFKQDVLDKIVNSSAKPTKVVDDESAFVGASSEVHLIEAGCRNMKIRSTDDLSIATAIYNSGMNNRS